MATALLALVVLSGVLAGCRDGAAQLDLYYAGSLRGNLSGCICRSDPKAGMAKLAHELRTAGEDAFIVDGGRLFDRYDDRLLHDTILSLYDGLKVRAVGVGPYELSCGPGYLRDRAERYPLLCSNLFDGEGNRIARDYTVLTSSAGRVGIVGLTSPRALEASLIDMADGAAVSAAAGFHASDPVVECRRVLAAMTPPQPEFVLVLAQMGNDEARRLARLVAGVDVIVAAFDGELLAQPLRVGKTLIVNPGKNGNNLGYLRLRKRGRRTVLVTSRMLTFAFRGSRSDPLVEEATDQYLKRLYRKLSTQE